MMYLNCAPSKIFCTRFENLKVAALALLVAHSGRTYWLHVDKTFRYVNTPYLPLHSELFFVILKHEFSLGANASIINDSYNRN